MSGMIVAAGLLLAAAWPSLASAAWHQPVAAPLNVDSAKGADNATITDVGGMPYVAWREDDGTGMLQVRAARLTDAGWAALGGSLNVDTTKAADNPSITTIGGTPYIAWSESNGTADQIRVKAFINGSWSAVGGSLNVDTTKSADGPSIAGVGGVPYVTWSESNGTVGQVRVAKLDGTTWTAVGGPLNVVATDWADNPRIADVGGVPFVTWDEVSTGVGQIRVKQYIGGVWTSVGGSLNANPTHSATSPMIASAGGVPYVVWEEDTATVGEVHVARFSGGVWTSVGSGPLNVNPASFGENTAITTVGGAPVVAWDEGMAGSEAFSVYVARFAAGAWTVVGGALHVDPALRGDAPSVADVGGVPYATWTEGSPNPQVRVARLEPDFLSLTATPRPTGATLIAHVQDFGVPLPIGFAYGRLFARTTVPRDSPGIGTATITQPITGLTPATIYPFRAFATDGTRVTATSTSQTFKTRPRPPVIEGLKLTPRSFRAAARGASTSPSRSAGGSSGTRVSYTQSVAATTTFTVQTQSPGIIRGGTCRKSVGRPPKGAHRCTITTTVGRFTHTDAAGRVRFHLSDRVAGRALSPGSYRLLAQANAHGVRGPRTQTTFHILP